MGGCTYHSRHLPYRACLLSYAICMFPSFDGLMINAKLAVGKGMRGSPFALLIYDLI